MKLLTERFNGTRARKNFMTYLPKNGHQTQSPILNEYTYNIDCPSPWGGFWWLYNLCCLKKWPSMTISKKKEFLKNLLWFFSLKIPGTKPVLCAWALAKGRYRPGFAWPYLPASPAKIVPLAERGGMYCSS